MSHQKKLKVMTLVGTRPEIIKLSRVIPLLDANVDHVLVHSGQNHDHELNELFFQQLEIRRPDHFLGVTGESVGRVLAEIIAKSDAVMEDVRPDALLLYGDTNTCLGVIPAKRRKIPVFHLEAGNRCFDERVPEEMNRRIVDHLSDVNMPLTEHARRYLVAEGLRPETIIKVGSPMPEVLAHYREGIESSPALDALGVIPKGYFLVSVHREENVDRPAQLTKILDTLAALVNEYGVRVVVSTHPRTRRRLEALKGQAPALADPRISFLKPFGFLDYVKLQQHARCVISDSGTITEEASILGFPAVTVREAHERPEGMDAGTLVMTGLEARHVLNAVRVMTRPDRPRPRVPDYEDANFSSKVLNILLSYTEYVNRTVWRRPVES